MSAYELAQLNVSTLREPLESPLLADFVANLDRINALAESSPGFVWRLQTAEGDATALRPLGDDVIVNMSVWSDGTALRDFVFRTAHADIMRRRREWFPRMAQASVVLWWIARGHRPTLSEAIERLNALGERGATPHAFTFRTAYRAPDAGAPSERFSFADECPA
jgi:hypothetical protein